MEHLDEGTVHAWLDGALSPDEGTRIEQHVATCADCSALVAEARGLIAASSRILSALDEVPRVAVEGDQRALRIESESSSAPAAPATRVASATGVDAKVRVARRAWWMRPQFSAAAVLAVVALGSLVVTRNRDSAIPESLQAPAAASAPSRVAETAPAMDAVTPAPPSPNGATGNVAGAARRDATTNSAQKDAPTVAGATAAVGKSDKKKAAIEREERFAEVRSSAPSSEAALKARITPPPVAPAVAAAKALPDSGTNSSSAREAIAMRKTTPPAPPPSASLADASIQRADSVRQRSAPAKALSPALKAESVASSEAKRIRGEPQLTLQNVIATGSAGAGAAARPLRVEDVAACWTLERTKEARRGGVPERIELTSREVANENGRPVFAARTISPEDVRAASSSAEWRWTIGALGEVTIFRAENDVDAPRFPIAINAARQTGETSLAKPLRCVTR